MKTKFNLTVLFLILFKITFGQVNERGHNSQNQYINGFRVYKNLSKIDSVNILKEFVSKLNGCWVSDKKVHSFYLSDKTFSGGWNTKGIHSTAPLIRIEFVNGQIKLIVTDVIGGDGNPRNIKVDEKKLIIEYEDDNETFCYKRLKKMPLAVCGWQPITHNLRQAWQTSKAFAKFFVLLKQV